MDLKAITIQPADRGQHFGFIAALMNTQETEPNTAETLTEWYNKQQADGIRFNVVVNGQGEVLGSMGSTAPTPTWSAITASMSIVGEDYRECGLGSLLYDALLEQAYKSWLPAP